MVAQSVRLGCGLLFHSKRIIQYAILKRNSDEGKVERGVLNWFVPVLFKLEPVFNKQKKQVNLILDYPMH